MNYRIYSKFHNHLMNSRNKASYQSDNSIASYKTATDRLEAIKSYMSERLILMNDVLNLLLLLTDDDGLVELQNSLSNELSYTLMDASHHGFSFVISKSENGDINGEIGSISFNSSINSKPIIDMNVDIHDISNTHTISLGDLVSDVADYTNAINAICVAIQLVFSNSFNAANFINTVGTSTGAVSNQIISAILSSYSQIGSFNPAALLNCINQILNSGAGATANGNIIQFAENDYKVDTSCWGLIASVAATVVQFAGFIVSMINPIIGVVVSLVGMAASAIIQIMQNISSSQVEATINNDSLFRLYAQPLLQNSLYVPEDLNDENWSPDIPSGLRSLIRGVYEDVRDEDYGVTKFSNGPLVVYAWVDSVYPDVLNCEAFVSCTQGRTINSDAGGTLSVIEGVSNLRLAFNGYTSANFTPDDGYISTLTSPDNDSDSEILDRVIRGVGYFMLFILTQGFSQDNVQLWFSTNTDYNLACILKAKGLKSGSVDTATLNWEDVVNSVIPNIFKTDYANNLMEDVCHKPNGEAITYSKDLCTFYLLYELNRNHDPINATGYIMRTNQLSNMHDFWCIPPKYSQMALINAITIGVSIAVLSAIVITTGVVISKRLIRNGYSKLYAKNIRDYNNYISSGSNSDFQAYVKSSRKLRRYGNIFGIFNPYGQSLGGGNAINDVSTGAIINALPDYSDDLNKILNSITKVN